MISPKELRQSAQASARRAETIEDERLRKILLEISRCWLQFAMEMERSIALEDDTPAVPKEHKP